MEKNTPLCCDFKCECVLTDALAVVSTHLSKTRKLIDDNPANSRELLKILKSIQESVEVLKTLNKEHLKFRTEYARELVEYIKILQINGNPGLQSLPYLTGKAREDNEQSKTKKSRKKKQKVQ